MKINYTSSNAINFSITSKVLAVIAAIALSSAALAFNHQAQEDAEIEAIKSNPAYSITRADLANAFPESWKGQVTE